MQQSKNALCAEALSIELIGLDTHLVRVEAKITASPASFEITGLSEARQRESRVRVRAALQQINVHLNKHGVSILVEPEDVAKSGTFDVAMALTVMAALGRIPSESLKNKVILGELSLTGALRPVRGVLPSLRGAIAHGITRAIVPKANAREAASAPGILVFVAEHISEIVCHLRDDVPLESAGEAPRFPPEVALTVPDMSDIRGMHSARRAMEIATAGGHDVLLIGQPGAGKTLLSRRLPSILPPLTRDEVLDVTAIHSVAGLLPLESGFIHARPFRTPHHTVSAAGLVGGGDLVRPGEVTLAHHGVLFLDELIEFKAAVLESLRQPLEEGRVTLCRSRMRATFPAKPLLVGAINPCPCGFAGDRSGRCACSPERLRAYRARLSGPLFDRFEVHVVLPPVDVTELQNSPRGESSQEVQKRVIAAREAQEMRAKAGTMARTNAQLSPRDLEQVATPDAAGARILTQAMERLGLSPIAYGRVLRVARTIADLDGSDVVRASHIAEALQAALLPPLSTQAGSST